MNIQQSYWANERANFVKVYLHSAQIDYENCVNRVQSYIADNSAELYDNISDDMTHEDRKRILVQYIREYLLKFKPIVSEYIKNWKMDYSLLEQRLIDEITNHGILTEAMTDDSITEIRINDGSTPGGIWVEKGGKAQPLRNSLTGELVYFKDATETSKFINNLLKFSKITMSVSDSLVNGTTIEGYRIAASDAYASARTKGSLDKSPTCVIRKFSGKKLSLQDLVNFKTITKDMAAFFALMTKVDLTAAVVGSTGSGKTITLQAILDKTPLNKRIVLIQNPPEIDMTTVNDNGEIIRDVVSWEAKELKGEIAKKSSSPTYSHLMDHSLRYTPQVFVFGELRNNEEFSLSMKASNSGHYFFTTFHAEGTQSALNRYVQAVIGETNSTQELVMETVCSSIKFIIFQKRLPDGTRKVISVDEVCGTMIKDGYVKPVINPIFRYISSGADEKGNMIGYHAQVGTISEQTRESLLLSGATKEELAIINRQASPDNPIIGQY